jgi:hypothetical protein
MLTIVKAQMLIKPYIHYIAVKIMSNIIRLATGLISL